MNCKRYQKYLHLYRPGELSLSQAGKLNRHLERCPVCAQTRESILKADVVLSAAKQSVPRLDNPILFTNRIMADIQTLPSGFSSRHSTTGLFSKLLMVRPDRLGSSKLKLGFAAAAFLILAAFFGQESMILSRVSRLEKRMAEASEAGKGFNKTMQYNRSSFEERLEYIARINLKDSELSDDWVTIKKSDLNLLFKTYQNSHSFNVEFLKIVQECDSEIRTGNPILAAESEKARRILSDNPNLLKQLHQLSKQGGQI